MKKKQSKILKHNKLSNTTTYTQNKNVLNHKHHRNDTHDPLRIDSIRKHKEHETHAQIDQGHRREMIRSGDENHKGTGETQKMIHVLPNMLRDHGLTDS